MAHFTPVDKSNPLWPTHLTNNRDLLFNEPFKPIHEDETKIISEGSGLWAPDAVDQTLWIDPVDASTVTEGGGFVTNLADKSSSSRVCTMGSTTDMVRNVNGSIEFPGSAALGDNKYIQYDHGDINSYPLTWYFTIEMNPQLRDFTRFVSWKTGGSDAGHHVTMYRSGVSSDAILNSFNVQFLFSNIINDGLVHIFCVRRLSGNVVQLYLDGALVNTGVSASNFAPPATILGKGDDRCASMSFHELNIFLSEHSDSEKEQMEGYLAWRHGAEGQLDAGHPYKSAAPTSGGGQTVTYEFNDHSPKLFKDCLYSYGTGLALSDGTSWRYGVHAKLDIVDPLDTGTATLDDIKTAYNDLLADMRAKGWLSV